MLCTLSDLLSSYLKSKVLQCKALLLSVAPWHQPKPSFCNQTNTQKGRGTKTAMNTRSNCSTISSSSVQATYRSTITQSNFFPP